jgi:diguanylate cyclase (GGDEF)-like protein
MSDSYSPELKAQALDDLSSRARGGIVIYMAVWLISAAWYDIASTNILFFWGNTIVLGLLSFLRLLHYRKALAKTDRDIDYLTTSLELLILANALYWGVLSAWILMHSQYEQLHYPAIILIAAFALGGTVPLSISPRVRILYPLFIYVPAIATMLIVQYNPEYVVLAILAIFSLIYVMDAARRVGHDYWEALTSHQIAEERAEQLEQLSTTDPLTQLKNRLYFNKRYRADWKRCNRLKTPLSVLMIDLDHFKQINDTHGHLFGDKCLRETARVLQSIVSRESDLIARYGGEEFIVLLPGTVLADAEVIAEKLVKAVAGVEVNNSHEAISMTCSIGISCAIPDHQSSEDALLHDADEALYTAKAKGRNRWISAG